MVIFEKYAINKYYTLEKINTVNTEKITQALVEKFMVVGIEIEEYIHYDNVSQTLEKDGFNSYKDALKYIEYLLEIPKLEE